MDKRLLEILCCPASKQPLRPLSGSQLDALNRAIAAGGIATTAGAVVAAPLRQGLMTADGKLIYRVEDDIPVMLLEEAIGTTQLQDFPA
ncbi:MAG TPA: Trm112 family protein [Rhodanobacteraceae bacterium]|nr:Trm112 family protein [Rhodanobacteraceae bacterium]